MSGTPAKKLPAQVRSPLWPVRPGSARVVLDVGEITEKGTINQRAALALRAALVAQLYKNPPPNVIVAGQSSTPTAKAS